MFSKYFIKNSSFIRTAFPHPPTEMALFILVLEIPCQVQDEQW
jgi:hypothetical protein